VSPWATYLGLEDGLGLADGRPEGEATGDGDGLEPGDALGDGDGDAEGLGLGELCLTFC
jgi:hypothetical protein